MCDDRDIARLLDHAATTGTKVVGIGDPKQLHSPGVGGSFAAVHTLVGGHTLSTNYRQTDAVERRALELWRDSQYREALAAWASHGRVHAAATRDEALAALLTTWDQKRRQYAGPHEAIDGIAILAGINADVHELNIAAQAIRHHNGELDPPPVTYDLIGGGSATFHVGDIVLIRENDYRAWRTSGAHADLLNGHRGVITAIDNRRNMQIEWRTPGQDGQPRTLREWVTPEYVAREGVTLGYAMTVHKTQGTTVDIALTYGAGLHTNALYTGLSRDRHEAHLFLPRDLLETTADLAERGEPATPEDELDRVLTYLANTLTHDGDQTLITEELHGPIQPIQQTTTASEPSEELPLGEWLDAHDGPAHQHRRATGPASLHAHDDQTLAAIGDDGLIITDSQLAPATTTRPATPATAIRAGDTAPPDLSDAELGHQITATRQTITAIITALDNQTNASDEAIADRHELGTELARLSVRLTDLRTEQQHRYGETSQPTPSTRPKPTRRDSRAADHHDQQVRQQDEARRGR